jgi:8-oxo-dGTP pyrophosphatase MutT (NUDIX family)
MSVEYFDVVDRSDNPTGELTTKQEAHQKMIPHRCAAVFVVDPKTKKLWVQVRVDDGGLFDHTVGGHVSAGEDYRAAALREMEEEIGITGVELEKITESLYSDEGVCIHIFGVYLISAPSAWEFVPNEEVKKLELYDVAELAEDMQINPQLYTGGFISTMKEYLKHLANN